MIWLKRFIIAAVILGGWLIVAISMVRYGLENTLRDDAQGLIRKRQIEVKIYQPTTKMEVSEFYRLPEAGMLSTGRWYWLKSIRDWMWVRLSARSENQIRIVMLLADKKIVESEYFLKINKVQWAVKAGQEAFNLLQYADKVWLTIDPEEKNEEFKERLGVAGYVDVAVLQGAAGIEASKSADYKNLINEINKWNDQKNIENKGNF